jgi:hypothetical protein
MCDCEELEFEDFEMMLVTLSMKSPVQTVELPVEAAIPQIVVAQRRK